MTYSCDSGLSFLSFPSHLSFNLEEGLLANQGTLRQFCLCLPWTILFSIRFFMHCFWFKMKDIIQEGAKQMAHESDRKTQL